MLNFKYLIMCINQTIVSTLYYQYKHKFNIKKKKLKTKFHEEFQHTNGKNSQNQ